MFFLARFQSDSHVEFLKYCQGDLRWNQIWEKVRKGEYVFEFMESESDWNVGERFGKIKTTFVVNWDKFLWFKNVFECKPVSE